MSENLSEDAEIKQLFVDESLEALQRVEQILLEAEQGTQRADAVDVMFRDMHTIKGTAALLGYERTAALAHAAEDLMSRLRDHSLTPRPSHFALMVKVVDALRAAVEHVRDESSEGHPDNRMLVASLKAAAEGHDVVEHQPPAPQPPAPQPMAGAPAVAAAVPQPPSAPPPSAPVVPDRSVAHDPPSAADLEPHGAAQPKAPQSEGDGTVRVNVAVLDKLMNLMGELVLSRNQMVQLARGFKDSAAVAAAQRLSLVTSDLQEQIMKTRMQPVSRVFEKIPRQVRDLCQQTGKRVSVEIEGTATELDKALVEAIRDPVLHIVRNAIDHGIETPGDRQASGKPALGNLTVRAIHEGSTVTIEIRDDGRGVDPIAVKRVAVKRGVISQAEADRLTDREAAELIFRPGFSTAEKVTNLSGRGVGMDVVRTHVERAGGQVELESHPGRGTTIRMKMPLTLAIIPALLVQDGKQRFAIPQANLLELVHLDEEQAQKQIELVRGCPIYRLRGEILPVVRLAPLLGRPATQQGALNLVVVSIGTRRYGLAVESIQDTEEIVIKPLHGMLKRLACYAGATVLGDGGVALILDLAGVATMAGIDLGQHRDARGERQAASHDERESMLVFEVGRTTRCAVPVSAVARLEQIDCASIEHIGGGEVLQYRGDLMTIVRPEGPMGLGESESPPGTTQQLLVFNFGRPVALAVDRIVDTTELDELHRSELPHTLGQTVMFGKTTLVVDVLGLLKAVAPRTLERSARVEQRPHILLADQLGAMRASLAGFLRLNGAEVTELQPEHVLKELRLQQRRYDAVVTAVEPVTRGLELVRTVRDEQPDLPLVCLGATRHASAAVTAGARGCIEPLEREALLEALGALGVFSGGATSEAA